MYIERIIIPLKLHSKSFPRYPVLFHRDCCHLPRLSRIVVSVSSCRSRCNYTNAYLVHCSDCSRLKTVREKIAGRIYGCQDLTFSFRFFFRNAVYNISLHDLAEIDDQVSVTLKKKPAPPYLPAR